jgi:hypothetical protein
MENETVTVDWAGVIIQWSILLGFLGLVYFVGRAFARLALKFRRNKWLFGIIGVIVFMTGLSFGREISNLLQNNNAPGSAFYTLSYFTAILCAILLTLALYKILKDSLVKNSK